MLAVRSSLIPLLLSSALIFLPLDFHALLADEPAAAGATTTFRIITYNVQFLPEPVSSNNKRHQPEYRARRIAEEVSPFDLVALQEMFHDRHRSILTGQLRTAWHGKLQALQSPTPGDFYTSGGCLLMTRLPMRDTATLVFADYSQPREYGLRADGFAAKGVIHGRIAPNADEPGNTIDVYVTHLEARADHLRPRQYAQMADFLHKTSDPTRPFLLLGDLNTKGQPEFQQDSQSQYAELFRLLRAARPASRVDDMWPLLRGDALGGTTEQESDKIGKRIDYVIVGNPRPPHPQLTPVAIEVKTYQDPCVVALSDHNAVVATFQWPAKSTTAAKLLQTPVLDPETPRSELQTYIAARIPKFQPPPKLDAWQPQARNIRHQMLERIIFRGEAARWQAAETRVEWLDTLDGGPGYRIRKFRYEALPGFWIPALLYEPMELTGKMPVLINVNGHHTGGKAMPYKQRRCINLARRGVLAFNLEFIDMGQLRARDNRHNRLVQIDLCGTSGLAPFYLTLKRGLDVALAHPHADRARVGVAGLSGGGWQTIFLAALDPRITLANPVAGYSGLVARIRNHRDVGDAEQIPSDMATVGDYTHMTALVAPRPLLLTYNAKDNCCFLPPDVLPELEQAARPIYRLYGHEPRLRTHINQDPGTHNFDRDNREALYRLVGDSFFPHDPNFNPLDLPVPDSEIQSGEALAVPIPEGNATLHGLASQLSQSLPTSAKLPTNRHDAIDWQVKSWRRLRNLVGMESYQLRALSQASTSQGAVTLTPWRLRLHASGVVPDDSVWTVPVVVLSKPDPKSTVLLIGDQGYGALAAQASDYLDLDRRVVLVDLLGFGQSKGRKNEDSEILLIATVGGRPLGIQAAQLTAVARWASQDLDGQPVDVAAVGPRSGIISLIAAAGAPDIISAIRWQQAWGSLKEFIELNWTATEAPELCCFGLLREFDIPQLIALVAPCPVTIDAAEPKLRQQLQELKSWYTLLGHPFDPLAPLN